MFPFMFYIGCISLLLTSVTLTLTLPPFQDLTSSLLLASPINETFQRPASPPHDLPALISNFSFDADNSAPVCNGNLLGFDMNRYSCLQAFNKIPTIRQPLTFGDRSNGTFNVQLPRRFSGRECIALPWQQQYISWLI